MESSTSPASQLSTFFNSHRGTPVHIEFHPSSAPTSQLLTDGPNIAIPKQFLIKAFTSANTIFTSLLQHSPDALSWSAEDAKKLLDASLILLLVGAENLTAVNTRRRLLLRGGELGVITPRDEVNWLQGVLTSPLAKHNKSPLLWHYRRWLVEMYGTGILGNRGLEGEMEVVERSTEVHPRNYYAWNYARFITSTFHELQPAAAPPIRVAVDRQALFCLAHVSDTSCWSFLLFLFFSAVECEEPSGADQRREHVFRVAKEVACFAHNTARGHESVWVFLKTVLASSKLLEDAQREDLVGLVGEWVGVEAEGSEGGVGDELAKERELETKALAWIQRRGYW